MLGFILDLSQAVIKLEELYNIGALHRSMTDQLHNYLYLKKSYCQNFLHKRDASRKISQENVSCVPSNGKSSYRVCSQGNL